MECASEATSPTIDGRELPPGWVLTRASSVCCLCDSQFVDELVLAWTDATAPGGRIFIELRHLDDDGPARQEPQVRAGRARRTLPLNTGPVQECCHEIVGA